MQLKTNSLTSNLNAHPPRSPLPVVRWIFYTTIAAMLATALVFHTTDKKNEKFAIETNTTEIMQRLKQDPQNAALMAEAGQKFMQIGDFHSALHFFEKAAEKEPNNATYLYWLGLTQIQKQKLQDAEHSLQASLKLKDQAETHYALALLYSEKLDNKAQAIKHLEQIINNSNAESALKNSAIQLLKKIE